jgi:TP901 family phage tail tape measure protein
MADGFGGASLGSARGDVLIGVDQAMRNLDRLEGQIGRLGGAGAGAAPGLLAIGTAAGVAGGAVLAGIGQAVGAAASFEKQMSAVGAAIGKDALPMMDELTDKALQIGKDTSFGANQAGQAMEELAKAGVSADDILGGVADSTVHLAEAVGADLPTAAGLMTASMNVFGLGAEDAAASADIITAAINESSASVPDFLGGLRNLGPVVANMGGSLEDAAAAVALFTNYGIKGADAGVSLARGIQMAASPTAAAAAEMDRLGISVFDAQGKFVGFESLFDQLNASLGDADDATREAALSMIFGAEAADVMALAVKNGGDAYTELREKVVPAGQAAETAATKMDNLAGDTEKLQGSLETLSIIIGGTLTPALRPLVQFADALVGVLLELPEPLLQVAALGGAAAGGLLLLASASILSGGRVGLLVSQLRALNFGLLLIPPQARLAIAAIAGIGLAYQTNFLGTRDFIEDATDRVQEFGEDFRDVFDRIKKEGQSQDYLGGGMFTEATESNVSDINAGIRAFGSALEDLTGIENSAFFSELAANADWVVERVERLQFHFDNLRAGGLNPLSAGLGAVAATLREIGGESAALDVLADVFSSANVAVDAFVDRVIAAFGKIGGALGDLIELAFTGELFTEAGKDAALKLAAGIGDGLSAGPKAFGKFLKGIETGNKRLDRILDRAGASIESVGRTVQEVFQGDFEGAMETAQRAARQGWDAITDIGELALDGLERLFEAIPWQRLWDRLVDAGETALRGLGDLGGLALDGLQALFDAIPWTDLWNGLLDGARAAVGGIGDALSLAGGFVMDALSAAGEWAMEGLRSVDWGAVWGVAEDLLNAAAEAGIDILEVGVDILGFAWGKVEDLWDWIVGELLGPQGDGTGGPAGSGGLSAIPLREVAIDILSWAQSEGWPSLREFIVDKATAAAGVIAGFAVDIGNVLIDVAEWAQGEWPSLREFVVTTAKGAAGVIADFAVDIGEVLVDVARWAQGAWPSLREFIVSTATEAAGVIAAFAVDIGGVIVDMARWVKGVWPSLREFVVETALDAWDIIKSYAVGLPGATLDLIDAVVGVGEGFVDDLNSDGQAAVTAAGPYGPFEAQAEVEVVPTSAEGGEDDPWYIDTWEWAQGIQNSVANALTSDRITEGARVATRFGALGVAGTIYATWQSTFGSDGEAQRRLRNFDVQGIIDAIIFPFRTVGEGLYKAILGIDLGLWDALRVIDQDLELTANLFGAYLALKRPFDVVVDGAKLAWDLAWDNIDFSLPSLLPSLPTPILGLGFSLTFPLLLAGAVRDLVTGIEFPSFSLPSLSFGIPEMEFPLFGISFALNLAQELLGIGDIPFSWPSNLKISFPGFDFPNVSLPSITDAINALLGISSAAGLDLGNIPWPSNLKLDFPGFDFPDITLENITNAIVEAVKGLGDISIPMPDNIKFEIFGQEIDIDNPAAGKSMQQGFGGFGLSGDQLSRLALNNIPQIKFPPPDTSAIEQAISRVKQEASSLKDVTSKVKIDADASGFRAQADAMRELGRQLSSSRFRAVIDADGGPFSGQFDQAMQKGRQFAGERFVTTLDGDNAPARGVFDASNDIGKEWDASVWIANFDGDESDAENAANDAFSKGNDWDGTVFTARFSVDTSPLEAAVAHARDVAQRIRDLMPSSPAKEGPLSDPISFAYIADQVQRDLAGIGGMLTRALAFDQGDPRIGVGFGPAPQWMSPVAVQGSGGGDTYVTVITLPVEEWLDVNEAAATGRDFAETYAQEMNLRSAE